MEAMKEPSRLQSLAFVIVRAGVVAGTTVVLAVLSSSVSRIQCFAYPWGANPNYVSSVFSCLSLFYTSLEPSPPSLTLPSSAGPSAYFSSVILSFLFFCPPGCHLSSLQVSVWAYCWRCVVVLHPYHHFFLHSQPGCFPHCGEDGVTHRERRGLGQADRDSLRNTGLRLH